ncbi:MAG TPA: carboxylesterase family protein [Sphingomonas sp.]|jgi:para-nitrobenzyl esterase|uniref:carboxylesterase/lipase family protein n=1 Tax=Sphingomonas sp. TaxID=28214 RepID=UPI002ED788A4
MILAALALASSVVPTGQGSVRGEVTEDGRHLFRGIPYAAPPTGALRWKPPQPVARWKTPRDATRSAPSCPQVDHGWNRQAAGFASEDCLYLEVATPDPAPARPMPVMVWIHGGSNYAGGGAGTIQSRITRQGVVLVSIQYRLGALGFLSHPALSHEAGGTSGNYGLMDQQAALRWVQANIARFGGDPGNVTLFGESAGAMDIGLHLLSPGSRGLFHKAIEESGTPGFGLPPRSLADNEALGTMIIAKAGIPQTAAALRNLPVAQLLAATEGVAVPGLADKSFIWLQAIVDGRVLTETPAATLAKGGNPAPLIVGSNARELTLHGGVARAGTAITEAFPAASVPAARRAYGLDGIPVADPRLGDLDLILSNDITFRCPTTVIAAARTRAGQPVWHYQFDYSAPDAKPVTHGSEIRYVLQGSTELEPGAPPMQAYWLNFARTGDPNGAGLPAWKRYDLTTKSYLGFVNGGPQPGNDLRATPCGLREAP